VVSERRAQTLSPVPRIAMRPDEAAAALGLSETTFRELVMPDLPVIRVGRTRLIRVAEIERWATRQGTTIGLG
jgi:excisionase family DNA binding protein